jgi:uncharacterized membrane protein
MKIFRSIMIFIFAFTIITCFPQRVNAEEDLEIPQWMVNANLIENGDLNIVEDITFKFNDEFNGVFREIVLNKTSGVSDIKVQELIGTSTREYAHVEDAKKGDSDVFLTKEENDKIIIQIFSPSENQEKKFRISYVVKNVAIKYNDTGELYYKFLGDENETPIGSFIVSIKLPQSDTNNKIKVFAHGPLNGQINKENNTTYSLYIDNVPSNTFVEGRMLFPREFIPISNNVQNIDNYSNIIEEEEAFQNKLIEDKIKKAKIKSVLENLSIWISGLGFAMFIILFTSFRRKDKYQSEEYTSIPEDCTPAIASYITGTIVNTNTIFATILDLFRKGYLKINEVEGKQDQYIITKLKKEDYSLLNHEKHFMNWMFNKMGNGDSVSTKEIESFSKNSASKFVSLFTEWKNKIKEDIALKGYYDKSKRKYGVFLLISCVVFFILGVFSLVYGSLFGLASLVISVIFLIYGIMLLYRLSDYGYQQYKNWISFKKYMKKYNEDLSIEDFMKYSSDISLIYALSLDVGKKVTGFNYSKSNYSNELYSHNGWLIWYILFMNNENNTFNKSMNSSFGGTTSSYSGGGFSGGGGGGAGGGGAGGF